MSLSLPAVLEKNGNQRIANTANDYWTLQYAGFKVVEGADPQTAHLSPQQRGALTRAANKAKAEAEAKKNSSDGEGQTETAGDAGGGGDLTDANDPDQTA
jgi:hypothetical protein